MYTLNHHFKVLVFTLLISLYQLTAWGVTIGDADRIFDKAESLFPELLQTTDNEGITLEFSGWLYRYYSKSDLYIGIDVHDDVYTLSNGNLVRLGSVTEIKENFDIQDCVTLGKPPANFLVPYKSRFPIFEPATETSLVKATYVRYDENIKEINRESYSLATNQLIIEINTIQNHHIENGFIVIDSTQRSLPVNLSDGSTGMSVTSSTLLPPPLDMPYSTICFEQTWQVLSYTETGTNITTGKADRNFTIDRQGYTITVKAINEIVSTPIGDLYTVHIVREFDEPGTIIVRDETWYSIDFGIPVKMMSFDRDNGVHLLEELDL